MTADLSVEQREERIRRLVVLADEHLRRAARMWWRRRDCQRVADAAYREITRLEAQR